MYIYIYIYVWLNYNTRSVGQNIWDIEYIWDNMQLIGFSRAWRFLAVNDYNLYGSNLIASSL